MKRYYLFLFIVISVISVNSYTNDEILKYLYNIVSNEKSIMYLNDEVWNIPLEKYDFKDLEVIQEIIISNSKYKQNIYNRIDKNGKWDSILIQYIAPSNSDNLYIDNSTVYDIYNSICKIFGDPDRVVDYGLFNKNVIRKDIIAQWDKTNFSIEFSTLDVGYIVNNSSGIVGLFLTIKENGKITNIVPLIGINIKYTTGQIYDGLCWIDMNSNQMAKVKSMAIILDYYKKNVLNMSLSEVANIEVKNDAESTLIFTRNDVKLMQIEVNRYTGFIITTIFNEKSKSESMKLYGYAEKIEYSKPLF